MNNYSQVLQKLIEREIEFYEVSKEEFLDFRKELVQHEKFKHFRGEAKQGGSVIFTYLENARS